MGARADFYVGRGPAAEWIGSIGWEGYPSGIAQDGNGEGHAVFAAKDEQAYRAAVSEFLSQRGDAVWPTEPWPWPWTDSGGTEYAYAFDGGTVYGTHFGYGWWPVDPDAAWCGERRTAAVPVAFPDMSARNGDRAPNLTSGTRDGWRLRLDGCDVVVVSREGHPGVCLQLLTTGGPNSYLLMTRDQAETLGQYFPAAVAYYDEPNRPEPSPN